MSKILLIHGSTVGLEYSIFKQKDLDYGHYNGISDLIDLGKADLFMWAQRQDSIKFWELHKILQMYFAEKSDIYKSKHSLRLYETLKSRDYSTIITHSMGGELLMYSMAEHGLPPNIKYIYTLASDAPANFVLSDAQIQHRFETNDLQWHNYHCFWDQSLLGSVLVNLKLPAGLFGLKSVPNIQNIFYPLHGGLDFHTSIIRSPKLITKICQKHL